MRWQGMEEESERQRRRQDERTRKTDGRTEKKDRQSLCVRAGVRVCICQLPKKYVIHTPRTPTYTSKHTHTHTHAHAYTHPHRQTRTPPDIACMHVDGHTHTYTYAHTDTERQAAPGRRSRLRRDETWILCNDAAGRRRSVPVERKPVCARGRNGVCACTRAWVMSGWVRA
jgi:hypothetical protein